MIKPRFAVLTSMIFMAALSRLVPHPWNFAPITGMALFAGAQFSDRRAAFAVPLLALVISDLFLGYHPTLLVVYGTFALIVMIGIALKGKTSFMNLAGASIMGSVLFFFATNFAHWALTDQYPHTMLGLSACFTMAMPFFHGTLLGDAFYTGLLFGSFALMERAVPSLQQQTAH